MARGTISKRAVDALGATGRTHYLWDNDPIGFGVRVTPAGAKSYIFQFRMGGRGAALRREIIGRVEKMAPEKARQRAHDLAHLARIGTDPIDKKHADRKAKAEAKVMERELAFETYATDYLDKRVKAERPRSYVFSEGILRLHVTPTLKKTPLPSITRRDIAKVLDAIPPTQPAVRRNVFAVLRKLFNWAKERGDIASSPMDGMKAPPSVASRDRVLSDSELALALRAANNLDWPFGPLYILLFATGQRREEVAGLDWRELDRANAVWTLPRERSKNGEANIIPLNSHAIEALDKLARQEGKERPEWPRTGLLFSTTGKTTVSGFSRAKARLDSEMLRLAKKDAEKAELDPEAVSLTPWRLHDARRTLATGMQRLGIRFEVVEAVLNHTAGVSRSGVAAVYQRHGWGPEKRAALDAWADHCERLISPPPSDDNIVQLHGLKA